MDVICTFDYNILTWIAEHLVTDPLTAVMRFITTLGDGGMIWIFLALLFLLRPATRKCGYAMIVALLMSLLVNNLLIKSLVARPRPFLQYSELIPLIAPPGGYSFPSGHSSSSFAAAFSCFMHNKKAGVPLIVLAALIAFSRLYVCVHFPTDVLCGSFLGILLGVFASKAINHLSNFVKQKYRCASPKKFVTN